MSGLLPSSFRNCLAESAAVNRESLVALENILRLEKRINEEHHLDRQRQRAITAAEIDSVTSALIARGGGSSASACAALSNVVSPSPHQLIAGPTLSHLQQQQQQQRAAVAAAAVATVSQEQIRHQQQQKPSLLYDALISQQQQQKQQSSMMRSVAAVTQHLPPNESLLKNVGYNVSASRLLSQAVVAAAKQQTDSQQPDAFASIRNRLTPPVELSLRGNVIIGNNANSDAKRLSVVSCEGSNSYINEIVPANTTSGSNTMRVVTENKGEEAAASSSPKPPHSPSGGQPIRKEKLQEALMSKPQRGRKREDLTDEEWVELTRMRNREHAKSNRLRKKARLASLIEIEEELKQLKKRVRKTDRLRKERTECFQTFLSIRQDMLNRNNESPSSVQQLCTPAAAATEVKSDDIESSLKEIIANPVDAFRYRVLGCGFGTPADGEKDGDRDLGPTPVARPDVSSPVVSGTERFSSVLSRMKRWDRKVRSLIPSAAEEAAAGKDRRAASPSFSSRLVYEIEGGSAGIALSKDGNAYAQIRLVLCDAAAAKAAMRRIVVLEGSLRMEFAASSDRLVSAAWNVIERGLR